MLTVLLNGKPVTVHLDCGAATSMVSYGVIWTLGLPLVKHTGTFTTADGSYSEFAGKVTDAVLALHPEFELDLAYLWVAPGDDSLFLLGNDILRHHDTFCFKGLDCPAPGAATLNLLDHHRGIVVNVPCKEAPGSTPAPTMLFAVG